MEEAGAGFGTDAGGCVWNRHNNRKLRRRSVLSAALLAAFGVGLYDNIVQACDAAININTRQKPDMAVSLKYIKIYSIYKQLYKSLKQDFVTLAGLSDYLLD